MIKNKDGSYNKFSLLILGAIVIITLGIIGSIIVQSDGFIDINTLSIIGLIITGSLTLYYGYKIILKRKPIKNSMDPVVIEPTIEITPSSILSQSVTPSSYIEIVPPVSEIDKEIDESLKRYERTKQKSLGSGINIVSLVITMVVAAATMMIGLTIVNSMVNTMPHLPEGSELAATQTQVVNTVGTAFNFMGLGLLVGAIIIIIGLMSKLITR